MSKKDTCGDYGGKNKSGEPCNRRAGWGTDCQTGRCKVHLVENGRMPRAPDQLTDQGEWLWHEIGPMLIDQGFLKEFDMPFFEQVCETYGLAREAYEIVQSEGQVINDSKGSLKKHPAMTNYKQMSGNFETQCGKLGMHVNARMAISIDDDDERKSKMEEVIGN